jgi:hypothetical protein
VALAPIIGPNPSLPFIRATTFATHLKRQRRKRLGPSLRHHQIDRPALGDTRQAALSLSLPSPAPALRHQLDCSERRPSWTPRPHYADRQHRAGRIQRQVLRAFVANDGGPLRIADLLLWCYPAVERYELWHRWNVHRAASKFADKIAKDHRGVVFAPPRNGRRSWGCRPHPGAYRQAMIREQSFEGRRKNLNQANKLSRSYATLLEALNCHCTVA